MFLPRCRTLPLPLLNSIRFLSTQLSSLARSVLLPHLLGYRQRPGFGHWDSPRKAAPRPAPKFCRCLSPTHPPCEAPGAEAGRKKTGGSRGSWVGENTHGPVVGETGSCCHQFCIPAWHPERQLCHAAGLKASGQSLHALFRGHVSPSADAARLRLSLAQPGPRGRCQPGFVGEETASPARSAWGQGLADVVGLGGRLDLGGLSQP